VFATLLVLVIHADHWPLQQSGADLAVWNYCDLLSRSCVPIFVVLTGLLLTYRRQEHMHLRVFARRRLGRSLLPWAFWLPIYTLIGLFLTFEVTRSWSGVVSWWLLGGGHLWYLILVPQLYVCFQFWPEGLRARWLLAAAAMALQTALCLYRLYAPQSAPLQGLFLAYGYEFFFFWIGYFAVGAAIGASLVRNVPRWPAWPFWLATAAGGALLVGVQLSSADEASFANGTGAFLRPLLPIMTITVFAAVAISGERLLRAYDWIRRPAVVLSRYSLGIYIVHEALLYIPGRILAGPLLQRHLPLSAFGFALLVFVTLGLAYVVTRLIVATPLAITVGLPPEPLRLPWRTADAAGED
jgi:surface polysaccharide O-acyltransferase-like enzyme